MSLCSRYKCLSYYYYHHHQRDTSGTPIPASSTPVSSQCCSQADTQVTSLRAHTPRPPLAAVSGAHRFQVSRTCISMSIHGLAPRYLSDYFQHVAYSNCRRLRSSSSSLLLIRRTRLITAASGTVCHMLLRQLRLLLFSESGSKLIFFSLVRFVTDAPCTDTPFSSLAVFDFRPL